MLAKLLRGHEEIQLKRHVLYQQLLIGKRKYSINDILSSKTISSPSLVLMMKVCFLVIGQQIFPVELHRRNGEDLLTSCNDFTKRKDQ